MVAVHTSFLGGTPKHNAAVSLAGAGPLGLFQKCVLSEDLVSGFLADWHVFSSLLSILFGFEVRGIFYTALKFRLNGK